MESLLNGCILRLASTEALKVSCRRMGELRRENVKKKQGPYTQGIHRRDITGDRDIERDSLFFNAAELGAAPVSGAPSVLE